MVGVIFKLEFDGTKPVFGNRCAKHITAYLEWKKIKNSFEETKQSFANGAGLI